jgi:hypothetical protein
MAGPNRGQHPARIAGVVTIPGGQPVRAPWILVSSADRKLRQQWATTNDARQGNTDGRYSVPVLPGAYLVRAVPQNAFDSFQSARRQILRLTPGGENVDVQERQSRTVNLTLRP